MDPRRFLETLPGRVARKFVEDQAANWAILIAWNALFAMFPIVLVMLAVVGLALGGSESASLQRQIVAVFPDPDAQKQLGSALAGIRHQTGLLLVVGFLGLLWGGSALFGTMDQVFAYIYRVRPRDFVPQRIMSVGMIVIFTVLGGLVVLSAAVIPSLGRLQEQIPALPEFLASGPATVSIQIAIGIVAGFVLFLAIFYVVPNRRQTLRQVWPGALLSGILFEAVTQLFPLYLTLNKGIDQYGKFFALVFVLLTFFFFIGLITMAGAELNSVLYPVSVATRRTATEASKLATLPESNENDGRTRRPGLGPRTALGLAGIAALIGLVLGRRTAH